LRILTPHPAITYHNHCPTSCRTNGHFGPMASSRDLEWERKWKWVRSV